MKSRGIQLRDLTYKYADTPVLDRFSIDVEQTKIQVITGANGSGKTTLLKIMSTLIEAQSGEIKIAGYCARTEPYRVRQSVSCAFVNTRGLFPNLSVRENTLLYARMHGMGTDEIKTGLKRVECLIADKMDLMPRELSTGMRQCVQLAKAFLRSTPVYLLDEPYLSLDESRIILVNEIIHGLCADGRTVMLSAQNAHAHLLPQSHCLSDLNLRLVG